MARIGRWIGRGAGSAADFPDGAGPAGLASRHLLLVPTTVTVDHVDELVRSRVPHCQLVAQGVVPLGRRSRLSGPFELSMEDAVDAGVPMPWTIAYALQAPVEREDPPLPGTDDRDGLAHAFADGLPWREEGRGLQLLVALARRLHGAVRVAHGLSGSLIQPDPDRSVDVLIHSSNWLEPQVVHGLVARILPSAQLAVEGQDWTGPDADAYSGGRVAHDTRHAPLDPHALATLHAAADEVDLAHLRAEDTIDAFAVVAEISPDPTDGAIEVLVHVSDPGEPSVAEQDWGQYPFVTYEVRWSCPQPEERERRLPSSPYLAARERIRPTLTAVARALVEVTGGVVTDEDGFWLDRYTL
jgi:hypothetical protein